MNELGKNALRGMALGLALTGCVDTSKTRTEQQTERLHPDLEVAQQHTASQMRPHLTVANLSREEVWEARQVMVNKQRFSVISDPDLSNSSAEPVPPELGGNNSKEMEFAQSNPNISKFLTSEKRDQLKEKYEVTIDDDKISFSSRYTVKLKGETGLFGNVQLNNTLESLIIENENDHGFDLTVVDSDGTVTAYIRDESKQVPTKNQPERFVEIPEGKHIEGSFCSDTYTQVLLLNSYDYIADTRTDGLDLYINGERIAIDNVRVNRGGGRYIYTNKGTLYLTTLSQRLATFDNKPLRPRFNREEGKWYP